jgi:DNA-binding response OmpR family regulator
VKDLCILVVDDDPKIRSLLRACFEGEGAIVVEAIDSQGIRAAFEERVPDLVTLDIGLEKEDGFQIARQIRRDHDTPLIFLTGKNDVIDRVVGLELGADDYVTKPFHVREIVARVKSVLRRYNAPKAGEAPAEAEAETSGNAMVLDGLVIDLDRMMVRDRAGKDCELTTADFKLMRALLEHPLKVLSRDRLMDLIDGPEWVPLDRTIDNQVARLRKKIERDPTRPVLIKTVRGVGYMLAETPRAAAQRSERSA